MLLDDAFYTYSEILLSDYTSTQAAIENVYALALGDADKVLADAQIKYNSMPKTTTIQKTAANKVLSDAQKKANAIILKANTGYAKYMGLIDTCYTDADTTANTEYINSSDAYAQAVITNAVTVETEMQTWVDGEVSGVMYPAFGMA